MGNVNHTYKVNYIRDDGTGMAKVKSYLVQRVNTYAFQQPVELMQNIDRVTEHIRQKHPGVPVVCTSITRRTGATTCLTRTASGG